MARILNQQEYKQKSSEILNAVGRLVYTKGFDRMTIQDILEELRISSGAFYHYFNSKEAVLEAFIERIQEETEKPLLPIVNDPHLTAIEKLQRIFATIDQIRAENKNNIVGLFHAWYTDANALIRQKVDEAVIRRRAPLFKEIVHQGIREKVFVTAFPDQAGEIILTLVHGMSNTHARLLLGIRPDDSASSNIDAIVNFHAAYMDSIERVLGAHQGSLNRIDAQAVRMWVEALRGNNS